MYPGENVVENETCYECLEPEVPRTVNGGSPFLRELSYSALPFYRHLGEFENISAKETAERIETKCTLKGAPRGKLARYVLTPRVLSYTISFLFKEMRREMCGCPFHPFLCLYLFRERVLLKASTREWT